jgi:predicted GH43/DUF377 family glycosyl hydrolase
MNRRRRTLAAVCALTVVALGCAYEPIVPDPNIVREVIPAPPKGPDVDAATMQRIYDEVKTPHKYGIVLRVPEGKKYVDCPSVFRHGDKWYMVYITFDDTGYETEIAESDDLLKWNRLGKIMSFGESGWDHIQKAGYIALQDTEWGGSARLQKYKGRYWLSYFGGELKGYETDPLSIGIAWTKTPDKAVEAERLPVPVLTRDQPDVRDWERLTYFKSNIIRDPQKSLGYPFIMYYNAKSPRKHELIGMAVSNDMVTWLRYGDDAIIDAGRGISGDPQLVKIGDVWVMFYFGAFWRPGAFDTFACSYDLAHWTKWTGPDLIASSEPWDKTFAHKPWVLKVDGVVYHFYCAVGEEGRVIALATSKPMK